jgi:hypothetical protein
MENPFGKEKKSMQKKHSKFNHFCSNDMKIAKLQMLTLLH